MIGYFYEYIREIVLFLIFMSFMQVVLPSTKYKAYINLVFGMLLIFIMLEPINSIYNGIKEISFFEQTSYAFESSTVDTSQYDGLQEEMVKELFDSNIKLQIEGFLENEYIIEDINTKLDEENVQMQSIEEITLDLRKMEKTVYVKPFDENQAQTNASEINDIKKIISGVYNVPKENIFINIT